MKSSTTKPFSIFNTLTGSVDPVRPIEEGHLRMYGCGPTVYSYAHIGNFRSFLTADLILRTAQALGWKTTYVSNITDVGHLTTDDTIDPTGEDRMAKALRSKEGEHFSDVWELANYYTDAFLGDWEKLQLLVPDVRPRATEHVPQQIAAVEKLIAQGAAYVTSQAVYFSVPSFEAYGTLSGNVAAAQLENAVRDVVLDPEKRDPRDFALWKRDPKHLMQWDSPWGRGFPGWHIECSVMAQEYLGASMDLHTGGEDLIFPHHECEIAQAESLTGKPFAKHWVHTRFLQVEGQKMSKRFGNFLRLRDLLGSNAPLQDHLAVRLALISGHYRQPFNFTYATLEDSVQHVMRMGRAVKQCSSARTRLSGGGPHKLPEQLKEQFSLVLDAMKDDLNTPEAIACALKGVKMIRTAGAALNSATADSALLFLQNVNNLLGLVPFENQQANPLDSEIAVLVAQRKEAKSRRDYALADKLRDKIHQFGVTLSDNPDGSTTWEYKTTLTRNA